MQIEIVQSPRMLFRWAQTSRPGAYSEIFSAATTLELAEQGAKAAERLGRLKDFDLRLTIPTLTARPLPVHDRFEVRCCWANVPPTNGEDRWEWGHDLLTIRSQLAERASDIFAAACVALLNPESATKE